MKKMTKKTTKKAGKKKASLKTSKRQTKKNQCCVLWGPCKAAPSPRQKTKDELGENDHHFAWVVVTQTFRSGGAWEIHPDYASRTFSTEKKAREYLSNHAVIAFESKFKRPLGIARVDMEGKKILYPKRLFGVTEVEVIYRPPSKLGKLWGKITGK